MSALYQSGFHGSFESQKETLINILLKNESMHEVFETAEKHLKDYYVGAGFIFQTVWNYLSGFPLDYGIGDVDIVYFDREDLSIETEKELESQISETLKHLPFKIDVKNEARVHLWYEKKFGYPIAPYQSMEDAIDTWPTTASSIGVKKKEAGYEVYAPFGLEDLVEMVVRPNKTLITKEIYESKAVKWKNKWPKLTVIPWDV